MNTQYHLNNSHYSVVYLLQEVLKFVIPSGPPVVKTAIDQIVTKVLYTLINCKSLLKLFNSEFSFDEATHAFHVTAVHHLNKCQNRVFFLQYCPESFVKELSELKKLLWVELSYHLHILSQQLEWNLLLQFHTFSRSIWKEKTKVNVNDGSISTEKNISVVTIFDLKEVR